MLPDFGGFLPNSSKSNYLYRCNRHPTPKIPKLTLCLPPARWRPRALDSKCSGNITRYRCFFLLQISSKLDYLWSISSHLTFPMIVLTLCLSPARWRPRALDSQCNGNVDGFLPILSKLKYLYRYNRPPTYRMSKITLCIPSARLGPREADSQCSGNISSLDGFLPI